MLNSRRARKHPEPAVIKDEKTNPENKANGHLPRRARQVNVFPVVKDRGLYRVLGSALDMEDEYPEPKYGLRLKPKALMKHEGRELAIVTCLSDDEARRAKSSTISSIIAKKTVTRLMRL